MAPERGGRDARRRGVGLADTIVACGVFAGILAFVFLIHQTGRNALTKSDVHSDTFRAVVNTIERIRREVRGGQISSVVPDTLSFYTPQVVAGKVQVLPTGAIFYEATPSVFRCQGGVLTLTHGASGETVRIASLGANGGVTFELRGTNLLHMKVRAQVDDADRIKVKESVYETESDVFMKNQP